MALFDPEPEPPLLEAGHRWDWRREVFNGYAHATARMNQLLLTEWGALSTVDMIALREIAEDQLSEGQSIDELEAVLLLLVVAAFGRSAKDWLTVRVVPELSGKLDELELHACAPNWRCVLPLASPPGAKTLGGEGLLIRPHNHLVLTCIPLLRRAFEKCFARRFGSADVPAFTFPLFSMNKPSNPRDAIDAGPHLIGKAASLLRQRTDARSSTRTLASVDRWLRSGMSALPGGDPTSSCRISARKAPTRREQVVRSQLHYGVLSRSTARDLQERALSAAGLLDGRCEALPEDGYIGGWRTPTTETMAALARHSAANVRAARRSRDRVRIHDAVTSHTVAIIMMSTGLRPNREACFRHFPAEGMALVFDKRVHDERVRPVPLAPICVEQLRRYREHLLGLSEILGRDQAYWLERRLKHSNELPLFQLSDSGERQSVNLADRWKQILRSLGAELPANLHRHWLRSEMVGGASAESIDAFLGHWVVGTEPWGRSSGLDPLTYKTEVSSLAERVLRKVGWEPEHGLCSDADLQRPTSQIGDLVRLKSRTVLHALKSDPSPFNEELASNRVRETAISTDPLEAMPSSDQGALGQILASAIRRGALLDPGWYETFLRTVITAPLPPERLSIDMPPADPDDWRHTYGFNRRWFCDPITELLIRRWRRLSRGQEELGDVGAGQAERCFRAYVGAFNRARPVSLSEFRKEAETIWRFRMPGLLVSYSVGESPALSLPATTWLRTTQCRPFAVQAPAKHRPKSSPRPKQNNPEVIKALIRALSKGDLRGIRRLATALPDRDDRVQSHIVRWAALAIVSRGHDGGLRNWGKKGPYAAKGTLKDYVSHTVNLLRELLGFRLAQVDSSLLDDAYREGLEQLEDPGKRNKAVNGLLLFQGYLCSLNRELDVADSYEEYRFEGLPSVNMVSSRDYDRALKQLHGCDRFDRLAQVVFILAFRTGMRLNEILALKHRDLVHAVDPLTKSPLCEVYVRPYPLAPLKTLQSRRMLPLDVLLNPDELKILREWQLAYSDEARRRPGSFLLTHAGGGSGKPKASTVRSKITDALKRATGDQGMRFEHLRHSFATQLLTCLLLPRDGSELPTPAGLDEFNVSAAKRDRVIARVSGHERPGRSALHIVSQLCGHGPVTTTLRWYTHMLDWSVGAYANRKLLEPVVPVKSALGIMQADAMKRQPESIAKADYRYRKKSRSTAAATLATDFQLPALQQQLEWKDGHVHVMSIFRTACRSLLSETLSQATAAPKPLRLRQSRNHHRAEQVTPDWTEIHSTILALRARRDIRPDLRKLGIGFETAQRWLRIADLIAGPRRAGEKHMRFEPKMSSKRRQSFDAAQWQRSFPQLPRGQASPEIVDQIWRRATSVLHEPTVNSALEEFCRRYSVDTGCASFTKLKDTRKFLRGMAMLGFADSICVRPLGQRRLQGCISAADGSAHACTHLRWELMKDLPRKLQPPAPSLSAWEGALPRSIAVYIGVPAGAEADSGKPFSSNNHTRYAVRFALTMLAIASLDHIEEPSRARGWKPAYGGYF